MSMASAAVSATKGLMKGVSPGVRASGPFAKQIAQTKQGLQSARGQKKQGPNNFTFQQRPNLANAAMKMAGQSLGSSRR
jgi:hypothetical protein